MPIALFPDLARALTVAARRLALWDRLAPLEEQLLRRARGTFLVRWFGPLVPEYRLNLHIAIANIGALRGRLAQARASMPGPEADMNLLRPMAAIGGTLIGAALSPTSMFAVFFILMDDVTTSFWMVVPQVVLSLQRALTVSGVGIGLAVFVALPALVALAVGNAIGSNRTLRATYSLMGDLAMMLDAFLTFWEQLTGPVANIRNPMLRAIMGLMDRVAHLFAQVLGFVSLIVVKVLPLVPSLVEQWRLIKALGVEALAVASDAVTGIADAALAPFGEGGIWDVILGLFRALMALPDKIIGEVTFLVNASMLELGYALDALTGKLTGFVAGLAGRIVAAFAETPVGQLVARITEIAALMPAIGAAFADIGRGVPAVPSGAGGGPGRAAQIQATLRSTETRLIMAAVEAAGGLLPGERAGKAVGFDLGPVLANVIGAGRMLTLPDRPVIAIPAFPDLPTLPDTAALHSRIGAPAPRDLSHDAVQLLADAQQAEGARQLPAALTRRPRSAFGALLTENAVPTRPDATQLMLRAAIYAAVGRVLPAALRLHAPHLRDYFDKLDRKIYDIAPTAGPMPENPQLELQDSGLLRPIVTMLAIRAPEGSYAADLRAFRDMVTAALRSETYRAADAAPAGG